MPPRRARQSEERICSEVRGDNAANIANVYDAPFPIFSEAEGERYRELQSKSVEVPTYFNFELLHEIGLRDKMMTLCRRGGWQEFVQKSWPVSHELTLEFFTTLRWVSRRLQKLWFRLREQLCFMDQRVLRNVCELAEHDIEDAHPSFSVNLYWKYLTNLDAYDPHLASNAQIVEAEFKLLHKFMCGSVFGKRKSIKCSTKELFLLWCIEHGHKPNMFTFVSKTLMELVGRRGSYLGMGYLPTAIAQLFRLDLSEVQMLQYHYFDVPYLTRCEIIDGATLQLRQPSIRTAMRRRLAAGESSSRGQGVEYWSNVHGAEYGSETEGQQPQPRHQSEPNLFTMHQQLLHNQNLMHVYTRRTQDQYQLILEQMVRMNRQLVNLNARVVAIDEQLEYLDNKWRKAWQVQGMDVPSPTPSAGGSPQMDGADDASGSSSRNTED